MSSLPRTSTRVLNIDNRSPVSEQIIGQMPMNNLSNDLPQQEDQPQRLAEQENLQLDLLRHLEKLIQKDVREAKEAMEMSQEYLPEVYLIAIIEPHTNWAVSLMNSDTMLSLMPLNRSDVNLMREQIDLRSVLEMFP